MNPNFGKRELIEPIRPYEEMLEIETLEGLNQLQRPKRKLFLSSISAGLEIGFSMLGMGVATALVLPIAGIDVAKLAALTLYPIGFLFVVFGRSELFTEHTVTALLPVLEDIASWKHLLMLWLVVFVGNIFGAMLFSLGLLSIRPVTPEGTGLALQSFAEHLLNVPWWSMLISGIFGGWLMALIAWIKNGPRDSITILVIVYFVAFLIGLVPLHHSIVGSIEVFAGIAFGADIDILQYFQFLGLALFGNVIGGIVFVTLFKWGHARPEEGV